MVKIRKIRILIKRTVNHNFQVLNDLKPLKSTIDASKADSQVHGVISFPKRYYGPNFDTVRSESQNPTKNSFYAVSKSNIIFLIDSSSLYHVSNTYRSYTNLRLCPYIINSNSLYIYKRNSLHNYTKSHTYHS